MFTAKTILVPIDFSNTSRAAISVALQIADRSPGARLILLHVDESLQAEMEEVLAQESEAKQLEQDIAQREAGVRAALALEVQRAGEAGFLLAEVPTEIRISGGDWLDVALQIVADDKVDLVCCATHGGEATGLRGLFQGSLTERLVHKAPCSVFVVKATGFPYLTD